MTPLADQLINAALYYGPGILLIAAIGTARRTSRWARNRHDDRADRRHYTALAARLHQVAGRADALLAMPRDLVNARLEAQLPADTDHAQEEGR
ncbi:hypothetical protein [Streptomyces sp. B1I3]|uniref:hypothetical protein n=1 Tax=Streptomyces sp. B1I3 TaxID=3042264 RepID=UPI0027836CFE|nr:hypothetical protein [Streptomyces sp. B1I3]MDQ0792045.1 hypothetical protein [Streptomyces sp. B1I3]